MKKIFNWGILGAGGIASTFVKGLNFLEEAKLVAVGSRSLERAKEFGGKHAIAKCYGTYEELVNDPEIDIIYVATRHPDHKLGSLLSLKAGKAVLCEKPFTMNAKELAEVIQTARESKIFLMEGMWTRFLPALVKVRKWLAAGLIGEVRQVRADFGFRGEWDPSSRMLDPKLGGGAILDVGIYPLSFAMMVFGAAPTSIASMAHIGSTGVDEQFSAILGFNEGAFALISGAVRTNTSQDAWILGTQGSIHIPEFWHAQSAEYHLQGKQPEKIDLPFEGNGYNYEAQEVMNCLKAGKLESDCMPLDESLSIMKTMDAIREQWNLKYPGE